ncbi:MAG: translation initiation factor IF-2, partial [Oscillospiraceae bacterium]|nr:translation initiation factor IF-2 [Oscillospiraceae bacterium]
RGTQATDIAILVVAADDGVMPQTIESIHHAKAAKCPVIVAINKIDKPGADPDVVKQELTQYELIPEEWGGDTIMVPVSAKTGEGIDDLLENVLLLADMLELKANPNRKARGVIVEAKLDHARGAIATALVQNGTLNVGDMVVAGGAYGRVRAMVSSRGDRVKSALPATPVEIVGFGSVPDAGDEFIAVEDEKLARQVVEERAAKARASMAKSSSASTLEELYSKLAEGEVKDLNIIIKADVQGSVEAVKQSLEKLSNDKVHVKTIHCGVGGVTENDVMLAGIDGAIIIGFNVRPDGKAREAAQRDGIDIRYYRIIYQAIEDIEKAMKGLLTPEFKENLLGHAEVRNVFKITGVGTIAGCYVIDGKIQRNAQVRLLRDNVVIFEGKLSSLQRFKDSVREVAEGYECGVGLENYADIKNGDVVECFLMEEISAD